MKKLFLILLMLLAIACNLSNAATLTPLPISTVEGRAPENASPDRQIVPHADRWGIYALEIGTQAVRLLYSAPTEITTLRLNNAGNRLVFAQKGSAGSNESEEIFSLNTDGNDLLRLTNNDLWDLYPAWSPDGSKIAFLSWRNSSLGIYVMNADGSQAAPLYDSSAHEADIDWGSNQIVFTKDSSIWIMQSDASGVRQISQPPRAGEWGKANLPFGDYDPRISPDNTRVVFERLVDDQSPHGNYDFFVIDIQGSNELRLTQTGYSQGLASWSNSGDRLVYSVAAINDSGQYDLYIMNADGTHNQNITPQYFPAQFLCRWGVFSKDDTVVYFVGEWWEAE